MSARYMNENGSMVPRDNGCWMLVTDYAALEARCAELEREREELQHTFELHYKAEMRGIAAWQEATGETLIWPDKAKFVEWILNERDALQAKLAAAVEALRGTLDALEDAESHLDYTGYGDSYERSAAFEEKLPQKIEAALNKARAALADTINTGG